MKAALKSAQKITNPLYDHRQHRLALRDGTAYPHEPQIEVAAGYIIDHPDAHVHCCPGIMNTEPIATPADDECRARVKAFMEKSRPAQLARLSNLYENIGSIKDAEVRKSIEDQARAYGIARGTSDPFASGLSAAPAADSDSSDS